VSAIQYGNILENPAAQYNGLTGGNPQLDPESSDTVSYGFVLTPRFLENMSLAVDYFDITVDDLIGAVGPDLAISQCLSTADPFFCGLIHRAPGSGSLWLGSQGYIIDTTLNTGSLQTKGIDAELNYRVDSGSAGRFAFQLIGTYVDELVVEPLPGFPTYDCVGLYGTVCGNPTPDWRHKARVTWSSPWELDLSLTWRHIESVDLDATVDNVNFPTNAPATDAHLKAMNYLDLTGSFSVSAEPANLTLRVGINNLTDEEPPIVGQSTALPVFVSGNTFPQIYDALGRYVFFNVTADF
jgi:outer membrane receptor protein involved in Fe transport